LSLGPEVNTETQTNSLCTVIPYTQPAELKITKQNRQKKTPAKISVAIRVNKSSVNARVVTSYITTD